MGVSASVRTYGGLGIMHQYADTEENFTTGVVQSAPWRISSVKPIADYKLNVRFVDNTQGVVDLSCLVHSANAGVFASLQDETLFNAVFLEYGAVTWPNGLDLAPDVMHAEVIKNGTWVIKT